MRLLAKIIATGAGSGYSPVAPGTAGSIVAIILVCIFHSTAQVLNFVNFYPDALLGLTLITFLLGIWSSNVVEIEWGKDPSKVVIDEIVGMWVSIIFIPFSYINLIIAFILFRLFDIWKPFGIRRTEKLKGGMGIMVDDVLAGILANICMRVFIYYF